MKIIIVKKYQKLTRQNKKLQMQLAIMIKNLFDS